MCGCHFWYTRYCVPPLQFGGITECLRTFPFAFERPSIPVIWWLLTYSTPLTDNQHMFRWQQPRRVKVSDDLNQRGLSWSWVEKCLRLRASACVCVRLCACRKLNIRTRLLFKDFRDVLYIYIKVDYISVLFAVLYRRTSIEGGAHMLYVNSWTLDAFTKKNVGSMCDPHP